MDGQVLYKVYDESDTFLGVIDDVISDVSIPNNINSTGMSINLTLARNADSQSIILEQILDSDGNPILDSNGFEIMATTRVKNKVGPGSLINHNYKVKIITTIGEDTAILDGAGDPILDSAGLEIIGSGAGDGVEKFTGFIAGIGLNYGGSENTRITLVTYGFDLDQYPVMDSGDTTVPFLSMDPSDILKEGLDLFNAQADSPVTYDTGTVDDTGTTVSYTFKTNTYRELIQKCLEMAPSDYFYYLDQGSNLINFKQRPSEPSHYFFLGKHIQDLDFDSNILESTNDSIYSGGEDPLNPGENVYVRYTETPATGTRRTLNRASDNRVTTESSATLLATGDVERNNAILYTTTVTIFAATYNINTINIGDMVGFRNFNNYIDEAQLQVIRSNFMLDRITLELGTLLPKVSKRLEDIKRNLILQETNDNPDAPS